VETNLIPALHKGKRKKDNINNVAEGGEGDGEKLTDDKER